MEMQTFCCLIITAIILGVGGYMAYIKADENKNKRRNQINNDKRKYAANKSQFYEVLSIFFKNTYCSYKSAYSILKADINLMEDAGQKMASIILRYYKPKNVLLLVGSGQLVPYVYDGLAMLESTHESSPSVHVILNSSFLVCSGFLASNIVAVN